MNPGTEAAVAVGVVMGSTSDWPTMRRCCEVLAELGVAYEARVVSAHRTPDLLAEYGRTAAERGLAVIVAGAGGAAHLPGMLASHTTVPVVGVPVRSRTLAGVDSLLSIVQMPAGVPVATMSIGESGATNAGLFAAAIVGRDDAAVAAALTARRASMERAVLDAELEDLP